MSNRAPIQSVWPFVFLSSEEMYGNIEMVHIIETYCDEYLHV